MFIYFPHNWPAVLSTLLQGVLGPWVLSRWGPRTLLLFTVGLWLLAALLVAGWHLDASWLGYLAVWFLLFLAVLLGLERLQWPVFVQSMIGFVLAYFMPTVIAVLAFELAAAR